MRKQDRNVIISLLKISKTVDSYDFKVSRYDHLLSNIADDTGYKVAGVENIMHSLHKSKKVSVHMIPDYTVIIIHKKAIDELIEDLTI